MQLPYWQLSFFYFAYFSFVGAFSPYWSLYLQSLAFSAFQIAVLMSLFQIARIFSPSLWGWLADHYGKRVKIIQGLAGFSLISYLGVFIHTSYAWLFAIMLLLSFFWSASLPLIETVTLGHLGDKLDRYGHIRMWGSIGFIFSVIGLGYLLDWFNIRILLWLILFMLLAVFILSYRVPESSVPKYEGQHESIWKIMRQPHVIALLTACLTMSAAHGVYYTFYSIYLVNHGYSKAQVGWLWALGVVCEILIFLVMPKLSKRFGLKRILMLTLFVAFIRFNLIGWAVGVWALVLLAQTLHAATFGAYHASAVALTHQYFKGQHQSKGQGLYTSISYGVGGTIGGLVSGYAWDAVGPQWTFSISGLMALIGCLLFMYLERHSSDKL
jgi:PPP family 3-phenylpropionic acid transporter